MAWVTISPAGTTTATKFHGDVMNKISNMFESVDISDAVDINSAVKWTFKGDSLQVSDADDSHSYNITGGALEADIAVSFPVLAGADTFPFIGIVQTWADVQTFSKEKINAVVAAPSDPSAGFVKTYPFATDANNDSLFVIQEIGGTMTKVRIT